MTEINEENYIIIPNDVFPINKANSRSPLNDEEIYLLSWLHRNRIPGEWITKVNIDIIHYDCSYSFANGDEYRNKRNIKSILISLYDKGYINNESQFEINKDTKNQHLLKITFPMVDTSIGYNERITYSLFDQFKDPLEFFIYAYIDCFGDSGRNISYYKWSKLARKSETTIKEVICRMNTYKFKPRIWKFSGDYFKSEYGEVRQQENAYFTRPDEDTIKKWNGFYAKEGSREWELGFGYKGKKKESEWGDDNPF